MSLETTTEKNKQSNNFDVEIAGIFLKLRTNHSKEMVDELVRFVDQRCKRILARNRKTSIETASILTALSIAEDLFSLKKDTKESLDSISIKTGSLLSQLQESSKQSV